MQIIMLRLFLLFLITTISMGEADANPRYAGLVMDMDTHRVLYSRNINKLRHPASLTKVMTLYLTFNALKKGKLKLNQKLRVSSYAASKPSMKLGLRTGDKISTKLAILALIIKSANDASVVLAEAISGSEKKFARLMNKTAKRLGMTKTRFYNASGLPHRKQVTTAYDMSKMTIALKRDHPRFYPWFKKKKFVYRGKVYESHNLVVKKLAGAEGLKTGYIDASGYNLITTAKRNGKRLVGVVMGGKTSTSRNRHMIKIIERAFTKRERLQRKYFKNLDLASNQKPNGLLKVMVSSSVPEKERESYEVIFRRIESIIGNNNGNQFVANANSRYDVKFKPAYVAQRYIPKLRPRSEYTLLFKPKLHDTRTKKVVYKPQDLEQEKSSVAMADDINVRLDTRSNILYYGDAQLR